MLNSQEMIQAREVLHALLLLASMRANAFVED